MNIQIREYKDSDIQEMNRIWNRVVDDGVAFPQEDDLTEETGRGFFAGQTYTAVAEDTDTGKVLGLYILHPNNVGRCGHILQCQLCGRCGCKRTSYRREVGV